MNVSPAVALPLIAGLLSSLVVTGFCLTWPEARPPVFLAFHVGFVCGIILTMAVWILQIRSLRGRVPYVR